jgi:hypothetical protein
MMAVSWANWPGRSSMTTSNRELGTPIPITSRKASRISVSVMMPTSAPSRTTGSPPIRCRSSRRAASSTVASGAMVMTGLLMIEATVSLSSR